MQTKKNTQQSRCMTAGNKRRGQAQTEKEKSWTVEGDEALACRAALIVEQERNDEQNRKSKANCRHKRREEQSQQQAKKEHSQQQAGKNIPNSRGCQEHTQQQEKSRAHATAGEVK